MAAVDKKIRMFKRISSVNIASLVSQEFFHEQNNIFDAPNDQLPIWDEQGRIKRWISDDLHVDVDKTKERCGCCKELTSVDQDKIFCKNMETFNTRLFNDLEAR